MAHVSRKKGRPGWIARWIDPTGKECSKSFARRIDATQHLTSIESSKLTGAYLDPRRAKTPFRDLVDIFRAARGGRPGTWARDDCAFKVNVLPRFGSSPVGAITKAQVQEWVDSLGDKGLATSTIKREYEALQKVMSWAIDQEPPYVLRTPCRPGIKFPEQEPTEQRFYSPQEIEVLYRAFDPRYRAMILVGCYAGLRIGEMCGLHRDDVLSLKKQIHVRHGLTEVAGKLGVGPLKTAHSKGKVDVPVFLVDELAAHMSNYPSESGQVFTAPDGGLLSPSNFRSRFYVPAAKASIGLPAKPHDMRHSFVSILIDQGASVERVAEQARHASPALTWRVYRHQFDERNKAAEASMQALENVRLAAKARWMTGQIRDAGGTGALRIAAKRP